MSYTPLVRKWSGQLMKNLLPTLLVVLCSYSSLYFPVISLDARGHLALLRFFQDVLVLHTQPCHNVSQHPQRVPAQRRDPAQHPQTRLSHPPRHLDLWLLPRHIPHQVSLLIHYCGFFSIFSHSPLQLPVRAGVQLLGHRQGVHREGDREKVLHHLRRALRHLHRRLHRPRSCERIYLSQTNWARHVSVWINAEKQGNILIYQGNQGSLSNWGLGWVLTSSGGMMWALCREEWDKDYCCFISPTLFSRLPFPFTCTYIHVVFKLWYKSFIQYLIFLRPELTPLCTFASHLTYI